MNPSFTPLDATDMGMAYAKAGRELPLTEAPTQGMDDRKILGLQPTTPSTAPDVHAASDGLDVARPDAATVAA